MYRYSSKGSSPDLMPSIMGALDSYITSNKHHNNESDEYKKSVTPKRLHHSNNFQNLSPYVQKILSNVPEQEISKKFNSEESLMVTDRKVCRKLRSVTSVSGSDIISPNVHKMLSNLPDTELVISANRNRSHLYSSRSDLVIKSSDKCEVTTLDSDSSAYSQIPLGSYLHSSQGIASRTPVGRTNGGKFLQVPSGSDSSGVPPTNSTVSSTSTATEVSRPVSLTSLGSCSSSGSSSGHNQHGCSTFLASAESLDSDDPEPPGSQGSADSGIAEQEPASSMTSEQRVLQEVLETETVYVADLNEVIEGYLDQWKSETDCPLAEHLMDLFSNLTEIYEFNRSFLAQLRLTNCDPTRTANVFLQNDSGFSVYNAYCANYPKTMEVLSKLQRDEKMAPHFREKQMALGHKLPLGSYLLKPVQRILKYHLLLQRLSKQCDPQHKPTVDLALTTMTSVASDINNMKRKHEHAVRVQEIQSQLYGWTGPDLTVLGELIAEGTFRVQGARGRRHVFLFEKVLLLAKSKQDGALAYKTHIMCSNLMLVEQVRGEPLSFQVLPFDNPRLQCTLRARSPHHKREWTLQIKRVILENYSAIIPNHARQLVMQLGQTVQENDEISERWSPLKHNITPHYLERRSRVRKTRDFSASRRATSQDRMFPSLGSWRRKSEPNMIPQQYTSKTMPKKISKLKKSNSNKEQLSCSTFYMDLSDSEDCSNNRVGVCESNESLARTEGKNEEYEEEEEEEDEIGRSNLEKIVSELLMQNQEFHKVFNREQHRVPRRNVTSEPGPIWDEDHRPQLPSKADSLPRSFQLNDQIDNEQELILDTSLKETLDVDETIPSRLEDTTDHPDHKIYRKSAIRLSIVQRIRMIMSEQQKRNYKYPLRKQGSKSMGEKLANPDYADPQLLFLHSRNTSNSTASLATKEETTDLMGERLTLDMSLNEDDVLKEIDKRLNRTPELSKLSFESSQCNSADYYETILDSSLTEEFVRDTNGKLVAKQDSFSSKDEEKRPQTKIIRRPTKAPPPIPQKPTRLTTNVKRNNDELIVNQSTSWVKTIVGRFE